MVKFLYDLNGFGDSSDSEDDVDLHGPEDLDIADLEKQIGLLRARVNLQEQQETGKHKA